MKTSRGTETSDFLLLRIRNTIAEMKTSRGTETNKIPLRIMRPTLSLKWKPLGVLRLEYSYLKQNLELLSLKWKPLGVLRLCSGYGPYRGNYRWNENLSGYWDFFLNCFSQSCYVLSLKWKPLGVLRLSSVSSTPLEELSLKWKPLGVLRPFIVPDPIVPLTIAEMKTSRGTETFFPLFRKCPTSLSLKWKPLGVLRLVIALWQISSIPIAEMKTSRGTETVLLSW